MKAIVLAAGYATRLYPLTENFPKPLLEIGGQTILDHLLDQLHEIPDIDQVHLVTNHKFAGHFQEWLDGLGQRAKEEDRAHRGLRIKIHDDGTTSADDRLGAIPDLQFVLDSEDINDDLLVTASDNILQFSLNDVVKTWKRNNEFHICVRHEEDVEDLKKRGNAILDENDLLVDFVEKPVDPKSNWVVPPIYIYPKASLPQISTFIEEGKDKPGITGDSPGQIVEWIYTRVPVYAHKIDGTIVDIGNHESLAQARRLFDEDE
jgi:glucose-1-phosphate thymidylyltransferase